MSLTSPLALGSHEDLERLLIENLLSAAEERLFFKDREGRYIMASAGWLSAFGCSLGDIVGRTDSELFSAELAEAASTAEERVLRTGEASVDELEWLDGRWISTTRVPLRSRDGSVIGTFGTARDVLAPNSLHDPLTGLVNRALLMDRLGQALATLQRRAGWVGVLFIDLDDFKRINEGFGRETGDQALVQAGRRCSAAARKVDTVARLGADELVILCSELRSGRCLSIVGARIVEAMRAPLAGIAASIPFSASVGGASTADSALDPAELLHRADRAMYAAKRAGGDRFTLYDAGVHGRRRRPAAPPPRDEGVPPLAAA